MEHITTIGAILAVVISLIGVIGGAMRFWRVPDRLDELEKEVRANGEGIARLEGRTQGHVDMLVSFLNLTRDPD